MMIRICGLIQFSTEDDLERLTVERKVDQFQRFSERSTSVGAVPGIGVVGVVVFVGIVDHAPSGGGVRW